MALQEIAVVTGAASGIGQACAELLAARGDIVIVADIDLDRARGVADAIGGSARAWRIDVSDEGSVSAAADAIESEVGPVTKVVANAGVLQSDIALPEALTVAEWHKVMDVDLLGVFLTNRCFARAMAKRGRGAIVNIASIAGMRAAPLHVYSPAKAAVIHLTQNLAADWGRSGLRVNSVSPGFVRTPILKQAIADGHRDVSLLEQNSALGRLLEPEQIARATAFLLSDDADGITGVNLPVDNGWLVTGSLHTWGGLRPSRVEAEA